MKTKAAIIIALALLAAGFLLDGYASAASAAIRSPLITSAANAISFFAIFIILVIPALFLIKKEKGKLPALYASLIISVFLSYTIKFILGVERPAANKLIPFTHIRDYSFPSSHAAVAFAPLYLFRKSNFAEKMWLAFGILVAMSRLYLGMHKLSEVIAGAVLGYFIGLYMAENSRLDIRKDLFELRRQAFHIAAGVAIAFLIYEEIINPLILLLLLVSGILISFISRKTRIPVISRLIDLFERKEENKRFPGKGAIMLVAGSLAALALFPRDAALASIMILALGDSFSHVIGRFFGRTKQPFSTKLIEGTAAGIIAGFIGAVLFVSVTEALIAAVFAMSLEAVEIRFKKTIIDDNLLVPLAAGTSIVLFRLFT